MFNILNSCYDCKIIITFYIAFLFYLVFLFCAAFGQHQQLLHFFIFQAYFVFYILAFGLTNGWYFAFDAESLGWSFAILICTVASLYIAIAITLKAVASVASTLEKNNKGIIATVASLLKCN